MTETAPLTGYELRIDVASCPSCGEATVYLSGELDLSSAPQLDARLTTLADKHTIIVDLTGLSFVDSAGLRSLLTAHQTAANRLHLRSPQPQVRRTLALAGLDHLLA